MKNIKYYTNYPIEDQRKFFDLLSNGMYYEEALKQSNLDKKCLRDYIYEDGNIVYSDIEKCWEEIESNLCVNDEYRLHIRYVDAVCYDYDPFEELNITVEKIDKETDNKKRFDWIKEQKEKFDNDFEKFANFVYTEYLENK